MDDETRKAFETLNTKFDSVDVEVQNTHTDVKEIKNQILQNCAKLDTQAQKIDKIMKHFGLE